MSVDTGNVTLRTETLDVAFRVSPHLLGVSLRHRGVELLRETDNIERSARLGHPCGIPLLHPWANRLERPDYVAAGTHVQLDMRAPLLRSDDAGLPLHGVPWSLLRAVPEAHTDRACTMRIDWDNDELLRLFPFKHALHIRASVHGSALTITTEMRATGTDHVPVSFGFHPYFGLPGRSRAAWRLGMPTRVQLLLDDRGIPSGASCLRAASNNSLGIKSFDDAFALIDSYAEFSISDHTRRIRVQCVDGYTHAQVYAPADQAFVCVEPMTAAVNALCSGRGLRTVAPGERFRATFQIAVEDVTG